MYKLTPLGFDGQQHTVQRLSDNAFIPFDPANVDFQAYQQWLAEGNVPEEPQE
jgi:trimethylamine:corrinoid methyltransferase-like protein